MYLLLLWMLIRKAQLNDNSFLQPLFMQTVYQKQIGNQTKYTSALGNKTYIKCQLPVRESRIMFSYDVLNRRKGLKYQHVKKMYCYEGKYEFSG